MQIKEILAAKLILRSRLATHFQKLFDFLKPDPVIWKGAGWGLAILATILLIGKAIMLLKITGIMAAGMLVILILGISILAATGIYYGMKLINSIPEFYRLVLFASLVGNFDFCA